MPAFLPADLQCMGKSTVGIRYANFLALTQPKRSRKSMHLIKDGGELIVKLYNQLSYARVLIGSHLRSIEGQTYRWRHN